jgi:hypothetical protein
MTERQWHGKVTFTVYLEACEWLRKKRSNHRKLRLWACACCRRLDDLLSDPRSQNAVRVAERKADGVADKSEAQAAKRAAMRVPRVKDGEITGVDSFSAAEWAASAAALTPNADPSSFSQTAAIRAAIARVRAGRAKRQAEDKSQFVLLRDVFGNPFRPVAFDAAWRTPTAVALARGMYESRDFGAMPILADALQDAGCDSDDVLNHCRDAHATHVRGCWVVDLVLGKE